MIAVSGCKRNSNHFTLGINVICRLHVCTYQPAFITTRINDKEVVRTNDIRVSEHTPLTELRLKPFSPIYNELTGEVIILYIM